ncbi:hypothetical protein ACWEDZ_30055, partial [Streptomyces sp. NPDC005047]
MSTVEAEESRGEPEAGAMRLCRAEPDSVAAVAPLLGERMPLAGAGGKWSVPVPEGGPWRYGTGRSSVVSGRAAALTVGAPWPVLALWWDADRAGCILASGSTARSATRADLHRVHARRGRARRVPRGRHRRG